MKKLSRPMLISLADILSNSMEHFDLKLFQAAFIDDTGMSKEEATRIWDTYWSLDANVRLSNDILEWDMMINAARMEVKGLETKKETVKWLADKLKSSGWSITRISNEHPNLKDKFRSTILANNNPALLNRISVDAMIELAEIMDYKLSNPYLVYFQSIA